MSKKQKLLALFAGVWAATVTVITIKNSIDVRFNLEALHRLITYLEQEQYDGKFSKIVNDLQEPPTDH